MPVEMAMWKMTSDGPLAIAPKKLNFEDRLEELVVNDPSLINLSILVIGHQIPTKYGGYIDVLGVDVEGRIHVIELKRDRTPREVVAQILDYGSWAQDLSLSEVTELYAEHQGGALDEAFVETFGSAVPDTFNADQRLTIVASELDAASNRIITFHASRYDVPINAVFFRYFVDGESEYLARTWLRPPEEAEAGRPGSRSQRAGSVGGSHTDYSEASFLTVMLGCGPWCRARGRRGGWPSEGPPALLTIPHRSW
jgi:hypothetical protein